MKNILVILFTLIFVQGIYASFPVKRDKKTSNNLELTKVVKSDTSNFSQRKFPKIVFGKQEGMVPLRHVIFSNDSATNEGKGWAIASIICGLVGMFVIGGLILGCLAFIFGAVGLSYKLKALAGLGMFIGVIDVVLVLAAALGWFTVPTF